MTKNIKITAMISFFIFLFMCGTGLTTTIIDNAGRSIVFDKPFKRIISLYGAHTENLFHIGADRQVIGVSVNDSFPKQVKEKQRFSYHDDAEKFIAASPDLILIRPMIDKGYKKLFKSLEKLGIQVVSLQPSNIDEMYKYWIKLGQLTGRQDSADTMVKEFKQQLKYFKNINLKIEEKKQVYFEAIHSRMKTFTRNSMPGFVLQTAGGINIAIDAIPSRNSNIAIYGKEKILSHAREIDVFLAQKGIMNNISRETIVNEPGFSVIKAVNNNQIFLIDEEIISRPVFRLLKGIKTIGCILYPEFYKD